MTYVPRAVGVPWFGRESYERIRDLPGNDLRDTFEAWEARANHLFSIMHAVGQPLAKVPLSPDEILAFAEETGTPSITSSLCTELANKKLLESEGRPLSTAVATCLRCENSYVFPRGAFKVTGQIEINCRCGERLVLTAAEFSQ